MFPQNDSASFEFAPFLFFSSSLGHIVQRRENIQQKKNFSFAIACAITSHSTAHKCGKRISVCGVCIKMRITNFIYFSYEKNEKIYHGHTLKHQL